MARSTEKTAPLQSHIDCRGWTGVQSFPRRYGIQYMAYCQEGKSGDRHRESAQNGFQYTNYQVPSSSSTRIRPIYIGDLCRLGLLSLLRVSPSTCFQNQCSKFLYFIVGCRHECPGHGAFADDDDDDDDAEEVEEAALSPRSRTHALFPRIAKISELLEGGTEELFASHLSAETLHNESGLDDNGEIWGDPPIPVEENEDDLLADDELCSPFCFWKKSNRSSSNLSGWSESELALLDALLPAYVTSKRCACLLAHSLSKRCIDVYFRVRSKINANGLSTAAKLLQSDRIRSRLTNKRGFEHWLENSKTWKHHERGAFKPCNHVGSCEKRGCPCYEAGITCEKACMCSDGCTRRFRGCSCARGNRPCWKNKRCDCYKLNRECDPDLCGTCGAAEALDPVNRYDERARLHCCSNMHIQKNVPKRTLLGHSAVAGWGLYMGEPAKAGDYLGEYKGEVISKDESERRGWVYDNRNISYLFDLNMNQVLDSTRAGNKFRYVNHQDKPDVNCEPRVLFCNMAHRIGMYATRDIQVGEELLFDYGYSGEAVKFVKVKLRKNSNNTGDSSRDASGTNKGSTSRIILTVKKPGKRGGARAGAGRKPRALKAAAAAKAKLAASATATSGTVASSSSPSSLKLVSQYSAKPKQKHAITPSSTSPSLLVSPSSSSSAAVAATLAAAPAGASAGTHSNKITTLRVHGPSSRDSSSTITSMKRKRGSAAMPSGLHGLMMDGSADAIPIIEIEDDDDDDEDGEDEEEDSEDDEDEEDEGEEEDGRGRRAGDEEGEEVEVEMIGEEDEDYHNSANEEESEASSSAVSASAPIMKSSRFRRSQRWKKRRVG
ncbi:hypothetical protein L228DRAFT_91193 [Xylona heveae TC161]|uniref:SET domain-containing protein n=1 Tax=Xylona heveae (strain CBS 132557 / TC161) TaxID=1328760 RepID=A0A161TE38_XYLHT|nr:hypothetical protein L228DRAFT_91193 [Xylona heveae TC161]KZF24177.1 hypothetical protein L228DRAFT_91193 [Xylona heveae TC161]